MAASLPNKLGNLPLNTSSPFPDAGKFEGEIANGDRPPLEWWQRPVSEPISELDIPPRYELLFALILISSVGNFALVPSVEGVGSIRSLAWIAYAWIGMAGAQFVIHSVLFCLWNRPLWSRAAWAAIGGLPPCLAFLFGASIEIPLGQVNSQQFWELVGAIACVPLFLLAVQLPFWMLRFCFRGRIDRGTIVKTGRTSDVWRIRDLLIGTAVVGALIALMKVAKPDRINGDEYYPVIFMMMGAASAISLMNSLPTVIAVLRGSTVWGPIVGVFLLDAAMYAAIMVLGTLASGRPPPASACFEIAWLVFGFSGSVVGVLLVIRRCGYRLYLRDEAAGSEKGMV